MQAAIGFIGLGNIGEPLCRRLLARDHELVVYDVSATAMARLASAAVTPVQSPREVAERASVVVLSLPNSAIVEEVVLGAEGLVAGFTPGQVLIDTSSSRPSSTRRLAATLAERGVTMLDAPVSGGVVRARSGQLAVMVGGDRAVFEAHRNLFTAFGEQIFYVGGPGNGHLTKALNNLLSATTLASAVETVLLGERAGLDPAILIEVVNASSGRSNSTEVKFPRYILPESYDSGFGLGLLNKDVQIALETAAEVGAPLFLGALAGQLWQTAAVTHGGGDHTEYFQFMREWSGAVERD